MNRQGFTLVELLVATSLAGMAVVIAAGVYMATTESLLRMGDRAAGWDRQMRASAWLSHTLGGATASPDAAFDGTATAVEFRTWTWVPRGWLERRSVVIRADSGRIQLEVAGRPAIQLLDGLESVRIDYFDGSPTGDAWLGRWHSFAAPPRAVRFETVMPDGTADTLLLLVEWQ